MTETFEEQTGRAARGDKIYVKTEIMIMQCHALKWQIPKYNDFPLYSYVSLVMYVIIDVLMKFLFDFCLSNTLNKNKVKNVIFCYRKSVHNLCNIFKIVAEC